MGHPEPLPVGLRIIHPEDSRDCNDRYSQIYTNEAGDLASDHTGRGRFAFLRRTGATEKAE